MAVGLLNRSHNTHTSVVEEFLNLQALGVATVDNHGGYMGPAATRQDAAEAEKGWLEAAERS